jgi:hypothetical protein
MAIDIILASMGHAVLPGLSQLLQVSKLNNMCTWTNTLQIQMKCVLK